MTFLTGNQREAAEAAELEAAEAAMNGTQVDPQVEALAPTDTPVEPEMNPSEDKSDWESRYKHLQSHGDKVKADLQAQLQEAQTKLKELQGGEPTTEEEVAKLREELATLQGKDEARETESHVSDAQTKVGQAHPDFVGIIQSQEFADWIKGQPQVFQDAIYADRPDAQMAINALTLYKTSGGFNARQEEAQQAQMLDQAAMAVNNGHREQPQANTAKQWTWAEINALSPSQYDKFESEIDQAIAEGRVR